MQKNIELLLCHKCCNQIPFGNQYFSITRSLERRIFNEENSEEEIDINESEEIITLCSICGNYFNVGALDTILKHLPIPDQETRN